VTDTYTVPLGTSTMPTSLLRQLTDQAICNVIPQCMPVDISINVVIVIQKRRSTFNIVPRWYGDLLLCWQQCQNIYLLTGPVGAY